MNATVGERTVVDRECEACEVWLAEDRCDERREQIFDKRRDDRTEGGADDDGNGQIDDAALQEEFPEVGDDLAHGTSHPLGFVCTVG